MKNVDHALYRLAEFPVLAELAKERTLANKLDGRACRYIYESGLEQIDPAQILEHEMELIQTLRVDVVIGAKRC